jgi:hypothetical protein
MTCAASQGQHEGDGSKVLAVNMTGAASQGQHEGDGSKVLVNMLLVKKALVLQVKKAHGLLDPSSSSTACSPSQS